MDMMVFTGGSIRNLGHGSDQDDGHRSRAGANASLTARISHCAPTDYRLKEAREKIRALLTANHAWCIHHTMMAEDFKAAREAWRAADRDLGANKVRHLCREKVLNVFGNLPGHFAQPSPDWSSLHVVLLPWLRGMAQMFQLDARRRWGMLRAVVAFHRYLQNVRAARVSVGAAVVARSSLWG